MDNETALRLMFQPFRKYSDFQGRARRGEVWLYYFLVWVVGQVGFVLSPHYLYSYGGRAVDIGHQAANFENLSVMDTYASFLFGGGVVHTLHFLVMLVIGLVFFIPLPALLVRRLHDRNVRGWLSVVMLLPFIIFTTSYSIWFLDFHFQFVDIGTDRLVDMAIAGGIVIFVAIAVQIVVMCLKGTKGANRFGPDPLRAEKPGRSGMAESGRGAKRTQRANASPLTNQMAVRLMFQPFRRYFDYGARARRAEFWLFVFFCIAVSTVAGIINPYNRAVWSFMVGLFGHSFGMTGENLAEIEALVERYPQPGVFSILLSIAMYLFGVAVTIPLITLAIRRLHDRNMRGWWLLSPLAFVVAPMVVILLTIIIIVTFNELIFLAKGLVFMGGAFVIGYFASLLALLVMFCLKGTDGPNRFGDDPLRVAGR